MNTHTFTMGHAPFNSQHPLSDQLHWMEEEEEECAECNGKGYAEIIQGWERPCDACHGTGLQYPHTFRRNR